MIDIVAGCDLMRLKHESSLQQSADVNVTYYPPASARREPAWIAQVREPLNFDDNVIEQFLKEIYNAIHNDFRVLVAIGTRSLLEPVMIEKVGDQGTFRANIAAFATKGYLATVQAGFLTATLDAGYASMHRAWKPTVEQMHTLMDVVDSACSDRLRTSSENRNFEGACSNTRRWQEETLAPNVD